MIQAIQIEEKIEDLKGKSWKPIDIAKINEHVVRLAYFLGDYHWHVHESSDELFQVYEGTIVIEIKGQKPVSLKTGEMIVIPKGVEHKPSSEKGGFVILYESSNLISTGD